MGEGNPKEDTVMLLDHGLPCILLLYLYTSPYIFSMGVVSPL